MYLKVKMVAGGLSGYSYVPNDFTLFNCFAHGRSHARHVGIECLCSVGMVDDYVVTPAMIVGTVGGSEEHGTRCSCIDRSSAWCCDINTIVSVETLGTFSSRKWVTEATHCWEANPFYRRA